MVAYGSERGLNDVFLAVVLLENGIPIGRFSFTSSRT